MAEPVHRSTPSACACCGAYSLAPDVSDSTLFAICHVLVIKALETVGKYIVRADRSRYKSLGARGWHTVHTVWKVGDDTVDRALRGAWDVVPILLRQHPASEVGSDELIEMLTSYVHDLVITGSPHTAEELAYRFSKLGLHSTLKDCEHV